MSLLGMILLIVLILALLGSIPSYPYSRNWGYYPSGTVFVLLVLLVLLMVFDII